MVMNSPSMAVSGFKFKASLFKTGVKGFPECFQRL